MDYIKLRNKVESSSLGITGLFKKLNMSRSSFYYMIDQKTLKIETLERICAEINTPVWEFFVDNRPEEQKKTDSEKELLQTLKELNKCRKEKESLLIKLLK